MLSLSLQNVKFVKFTVITKKSLRKHSKTIFEGQNENFAKNNEAHENLPHAYKKRVFGRISSGREGVI